jgi:hypothetical protein
MWWQLVAQNPTADIGTRGSARARADRLIAVMTSAEIEEGQRRAANFEAPLIMQPNPVEADLDFAALRFSAVVGLRDRPHAVINGVPFAVGETKSLSVDDEIVRLECLSIDAKGARVGIAGTYYQKVLELK